MKATQNKFSFRARLKSFQYAFSGIKAVVGTQHNFRIHLLIAAAVVVAGLLTGLSNPEWLAVILAMGLVLSAEAMNSAVEQMVDLLSPGLDRKAGMVKDMAAGAVLIAAIVAAVTGLIVFIPKLIHIL